MTHKFYNVTGEGAGGENKMRFVPLEATLPKYPGMYLCKVKAGNQVAVHEVEYVTLSDGNMDFDLDDFPEGAEVIAFRHLKSKP